MLRSVIIYNGENQKRVKSKHVKSKTRVRKDKSGFEKEHFNRIKTNNKNLFQNHHIRKPARESLWG